MALTRKFLKALGIEDEKIDQIIEEHTTITDRMNGEIAIYKADAEKLPAVQKELDDLKAAKDGGYKEKYEKEHKAFEDFKNEQSAKESKAAKEKAYRELLISAGVSEKRVDSVLKVSDLSKIELEDGKVKGADELAKTIKTEWADFIVSTRTNGVQTHTPPQNTSGDGKWTKADVYKKDDKGRYVLSTAERQKILSENPEIR